MDRTSLLEFAPDAGRVLLRRVLLAALIGGIVAGALDILYAFAFYGLRSVPPGRILQSVASGLLGRASYAGGLWTMGLGAVCHFAIAIVMAGTYAVMSLRFPVLREQAVVCGAAYGAMLFFIMNYVVVPLSLAIPKGPPPSPAYELGLAVHIALVGIPIALAARWALRDAG
jgi:uncharacterized membrane protein YagU involved in acid resistance